MMGKGGVVVLGGSAGSFKVVTYLLGRLPQGYPLPVVLCLHRLKDVRSGFMESLQGRSNLEVREPYDKEPIQGGRVYLAASNYHLYVELGNRFGLSTGETVNHSRPSIDLTFISAARVYRERAVGILVSGANRDGALGLQYLKKQGGVAIVQDPAECEVQTMTAAALQLTQVDQVLGVAGIAKFLLELA